MFQSAPDPKAGRYALAAISSVVKTVVSIRSRPEGREILGDSLQCSGLHEVSIRSRPEGREILNMAPGLSSWMPVSIRSRPEGREIPMISKQHHQINKSFQSAPDPKAGRYAAMGEQYRVRGDVSIRSRPEGREIRRRHIGVRRTDCEFQSAPDPKAGRYTGHLIDCRSHFCFNPLPTRRPGDTYDLCTQPD